MECDSFKEVPSVGALLVDLQRKKTRNKNKNQSGGWRKLRSAANTISIIKQSQKHDTLYALFWWYLILKQPEIIEYMSICGIECYIFIIYNVARQLNKK